MNKRTVACLTLGVVLAASGGAGLLGAEAPEAKFGVDVRMQRTGPQFDPCSVPGLVGWWRADRGVRAEAGRVQAWADAGGHDSDLVAPGTQEQPALLPGVVNGLPAVRFGAGPSGGLSPCVLSCRELSLGQAPAGITIAAVARMHATTFYTPVVSYGEAVVLGQEGNTGRLRGTVGGESLVGRGFHVLVATFDPATNRYAGYVDAQRVVESGNVFRSLPPKAPLSLGVRGTGENRGLMGDLAEVAVYDRVLPGDRLAGLVRHLLNRYGLEAGQHISPLASLLPYAYYPTSNQIEVAFDRDSPILAEHFRKDLRPSQSPAQTSPGLAMAYFPTTAEKPQADVAKDTPSITGALAGFVFKHKDQVLAGHGRRPNVLVLKGYLDVPADGAYQFHLRPYSFGRVQVAGRTVIDTSHRPTFNEMGGVIALAKGRHAIAALCRVHNQPAELPLEFLWWTPPGGARASIPPEALSHVEITDWRVANDGPQAPAAMPAELAGLKEAALRVVSLSDGRAVAQQTLKLDSQGRGQGRFALPNLADGEYAVEWLLAGKTVRATVPFRRIRYEWEGTTLGREHKVYPPFEPVKVDGGKVSVVGRTYAFNAMGLMDSAVSKGRELLAGPMTLHVQTDGKELAWRPGSIAGRQVHEDQTALEGSAECDAVKLTSHVLVEEDGAARITWDFAPGPTPGVIERMWLDIPLKDAEVPLFHYTGSDSMRHNYAGRTPRGGRIVWETDADWGHPLPKWVPTAWRVEPGSGDGVIWDSTKINRWSPGNRDNFCPYVWLGAEERGLAWFAGTDHDYINDRLEAVQEVIRDGGRVVLRVHIVKQPTPADTPRRIVFGLQASPTKPMPAGWQADTVPGGGGLAVHPWGGYQCADKYPDNRNYEIIDYIQAVRRTGKVTPGRLEAFDAARLWKDALVHDDGNWVQDVRHFEGAAKNDAEWKTYDGSGVYTEEHAQNIRAPEWQVFQDEWSIFEFNRFADQEGNWSQAAESYRDFCVFHNYQWLRRGVSVYFDNCMHRIAFNPYNQGFVGRTITIWEMREYYKRVWKTLTRLNAEGVPPFKVHFTGHITNTQTIPQNTWLTATLDLEQAYRWDWDRPCQYPVPKEHSGGGHYLLPFPADYTRTMTMGRLVGVIPHAMHPLINWGDYRDKERDQIDDRVHVADWGMYRVHEVRGGGSISPTAHRLSEYLTDFGYGQAGTRVINYWDEDSPVKVEGADVKFLAVLRKAQPFAFLVLQSYQEAPAKVTVRFPGAAAAMDVLTRRPAEVRDQTLSADIDGPYGTRVFLLADGPASIHPAPAGNDVAFSENFEFGLRLPGKLSSVWGKQKNERPARLAADAEDPTNTVLQFHPCPGGQAVWTLSPTAPLAGLGDHEMTFRFRVRGLGVPGAKIVNQPIVAMDVGVEPARPKPTYVGLRLDLLGGEKPGFVGSLHAGVDGQAATFTDAAVDLRGKCVPGVAVDGRWHKFTFRLTGTRLVVLLDDVTIFDGQGKGSPAGGWRLHNAVDPSQPAAAAPTEIDDVLIRRLLRPGP